MNKEQALVADRSLNILPGGQGEHDFRLADGIDAIRDRLTSFAEECGGSVRLYEGGDALRLWTPNEGVFVIKMGKDLSRVSSIVELHKDRSPTLYWDERRVRVLDHFYQVGNADQAFLSDWEMTAEELAADAARIREEQSEVPPPPTPRVSPEELIQAATGLTKEEVRNPHLPLEVYAACSAFEHERNRLVHSELTTLGRLKRTIEHEYGDGHYIFLPSERLSPEAGPQLGDVVIRARKTRAARGVVTAAWGHESVEPGALCINASAFWNPLEVIHRCGKPDCSGGPWETLEPERCVHVGTTLQRFWYWSEGYPGWSHGTDYYREVNVWYWMAD